MHSTGLKVIEFRPGQPPLPTAPQIFNVYVMDADTVHGKQMFMRFVPYPGLYMRAPWKNSEYQKVTEVYWNDENNQFLVCLGKSK